MTINKDSASPTVVDHEDVVPKAESVTSPTDNKGKKSFRQAGAVLAILVCYAMVGINITLLSPSLTRIAHDLGYLVGRQWIVTSYMISYLTTMPISGKLSDIFGRRKVLILATFLFAFCPIAAALAPNFTTLVVARGLQGLGGGICATVPSIILDDIAPTEKKALFQSMISFVMGVSNLVGPIIGGAFTDQVSWRWAFWLNVLLGIISLLMTVVFVQETVIMQESSSMQKLKHIDWIGILAILAFVSCLLLLLQWGPDDSWSSPRVIATAIGTGLTLAILIAVESLLAKDPVIPGVVFNRSSFGFYVFALVVNLTAFSVLYYMSIFFESVYNASSLESAIRLLPSMGAVIAGSMATHFLFRIVRHIKLALVADAILYIVAYGLVQTLVPTSNWSQQALYFMPAFFGISLRRTAAIIGVRDTCSNELAAMAISQVIFLSCIGFTLGLPIFELLQKITLSKEIDAMDHSVKEQAIRIMGSAGTDYFAIRHMPKQVQDDLIHAYMSSMLQVFRFPLAVGGVMLILALLMKNIRYA